MGGTHLVRAAHVSLISAVIGTQLDFVSEEFRLLPRRELTALIDLVPVDQVVEVLEGSATRRTVVLAGKIDTATGIEISTASKGLCPIPPSTTAKVS